MNRDWKAILGPLLLVAALTGCGDDSDGSGEEQVTVLQQVSRDGPNGFLWKPISESDGRLVVLLPESFTARNITAVDLYPDDTPAPEERLVDGFGNFSSIANGNRRHYRYARRGDGYPPNTWVIATETLPDGTTVLYGWLVDTTAERVD